MSKKGPRKDPENNDDGNQGGDTSSLQSQPVLDPRLLRSKLQMLAWIRVGLGIAAGMLAGLLGTYYEITSTGLTFNPNAYSGLLVAFAIYAASYYLGKNGLGIILPRKDRNKLITQGIGGYFMMFLFFWIIYNTYCFSINGACFSFHLF